MAPRALLAGLFAVCLLAAGCSPDEALDAGEAATVAAGSVVEVAAEDGTWDQREGGATIPTGARVRAGGDDVRLTLRDGSLRLSPDAEATLTASRITLERGEALVDSDGGLSAALEDTTVTGAATYRLSSGLASRVGVYRGEVSVTRPAQERLVATLRQLDIADFRLAATPEPLRYVDSDAWDQELLADAIAFDGEAARLLRGIDLELGTRPQPAQFYRQFAAPRLVAVVADGLTARAGRRLGPPSDVLLTVFIAGAAAGDDAREAVRTITGLRRDGARWGLIAMELDVESDRVVAAIDRLGNRSLALADRSPAERSAGIGSAVGPPADGAAGGTGGTVVGAGATSAGTSGDGAPPASGDDGDNDGDGGGEDPPPPTEGPGGGDPKPPPPPPPSEDPVEKVVNDVVDGIGQTPDGDDTGGRVPVPDTLEPVRNLLSSD